MQWSGSIFEKTTQKISTFPPLHEEIRQVIDTAKPNIPKTRISVARLGLAIIPAEPPRSIDQNS
ncbi:hypothetical protein AAHB54_23145 [Bacillus cereus]